MKKKFVNSSDDLVSELLEGFAIAHRNTIKLTDKKLVVRANPKSTDKVAIVTLGGSGHEPALSGFVGEGLLDISVPGEIFAAPGPPRLMEGLREANRDAGVLLVVLNHAGDVMSANMAMEMAKSEGLNVKQLLTCEDISGGPRSNPDDRRGLAGCLWVYKIAGAAAEQGKSLDEVVEIAQRVADNMATQAVAISAATHPATGDVIAEVPAGRMIIGMGQHGEAGGGGDFELVNAEDTVSKMLPNLLEDLDAKEGDDIMVMVNGVGSTTLMELYIVLGSIKKLLEKKGMNLARAIAGEFLTVQEMGGFQISIVKADEEMLELWDAPCKSPAFTI